MQDYMVVIMHLSMCCPWCCPNNPYSPPPFGLKWGFGRGFDAKIRPTMGHFDNFKKSSSHQIPTQVPTSHLGFTWGFDSLGQPHYGAFDILVCQIPTNAPYKPEEGGGVGSIVHY